MANLAFNQLHASATLAKTLAHHSRVRITLHHASPRLIKVKLDHAQPRVMLSYYCLAALTAYILIRSSCQKFQGQFCYGSSTKYVVCVVCLVDEILHQLFMLDHA